MSKKHKARANVSGRWSDTFGFWVARCQTHGCAIQRSPSDLLLASTLNPALSQRDQGQAKARHTWMCKEVCKRLTPHRKPADGETWAAVGVGFLWSASSGSLVDKTAKKGWKPGSEWKEKQRGYKRRKRRRGSEGSPPVVTRRRSNSNGCRCLRLGFLRDTSKDSQRTLLYGGKADGTS